MIRTFAHHLGLALVCVSLISAACGKTDNRKERDLMSPSGGERWSADSLHYIRWRIGSDSEPGTVRIEYSPNAGKVWEEVAASAPCNGTFLWKVPSTPSRSCKIRITGGGTDRVIQSHATFSILPSQRVSGYRWVKVTNPAVFAPRDGAGALSYQDRMWLLGGWNPGDRPHFPRICNNEVWSSEDGADWHLEKPNTFLDRSFDPRSDWEGRHTAGCVVYKGKMWIVGGDGNQGHYQSDVWSSTDGLKWDLVTEEVPWGPRVLHYTYVFKDKIWVAGGQTVPQIAAEEEVFHRDLWNTSDGIHWEQVTPKEPFWEQRGMIGGSVVFKGRMWILGGGTYDTPKHPQRKFYNDVWSSADGVNWKCDEGCAPWFPRQYHEVAVWDNRMWVMEGWNQQNRNDVWYSSDGVNWYELPETPWKPRHAASVFVFKDALWMVAGNNMESDVWKLVRGS
ncbi:MAG: hypothetical protein HY318_11100 [Armatimonadetes bacterium]|nr:hypothetical protein [Armatimonadota bacterium]